MNAFDDMTLGEVEEVSTTVLHGKSFGDDGVDNLQLAGGIMWITKRRENPSLTWDEFKNSTKMADIKSFSIDMEAESELDPTNVRNAPTT